jgi:hypothetical protein
MLAVMMASPQLEKNLTTHMGRPAFEQYEQYALRSQILKAKVASSGTTMQKEMAAAALKLGIPATELPKLSVNLARAKTAVLSGAGGLSAERAGRALAFLAWAEETPVAGKHIPAERAGEMIDMFNQMNRAIATKNADLLIHTTEKVMAEGGEYARKLLKEGMSVATEDLASGEITRMHIPGLGLEDTSRGIMEAMRAHEALGGETSAARMHGLFSGRVAPADPAEVARMFSREGKKLSPFGAFLPTIEGEGMSGMMAKIQAKEMALVNRLGAAGQKMIRHAKPLGIGLAASIGLAMALSKPSATLMPEQKQAPVADMTSGTGGAEIGTNLHPEGTVQGHPTARSHVDARNTARITSAGSMKRIRIDGVASRPVDYNSFGNQLRQTVGPARIHTTLDDRRMTLTPQKLSDMLDE